MRIALLAHNLRVAGGLSVGKNLTASLLRVAPRHEYLLTVPANVGYEGYEHQSNVDVIQVPRMSMRQRIRFEQAGLPRVIRAFSPDLAWALGNVPLKNPPCRQALLIQDAHLFYPSTHYRLETTGYRFSKWLVKRRLAQCLRSVDVAFCQTETARRRFAEAYDYDISRTFVLPNAVSQFAIDDVPGEAPEALAPFPDRFKLFALTKYYAHKNLERIVETYCAYHDELRDTLCVLTVDPADHPRARGLLESVRRRDLQDCILNVGRLDQPQLAGYFKTCHALLLPTLLESFSGTYLEAMHFECPILTSDLDFARDICGDAAMYFDPWQPATVKDAIVQLRDDEASQKDLVVRGRARLQQTFRSWEDVMRKALDDLGIPQG